MNINSSLDWTEVRSKLRENANRIGGDPRFQKMLTHLENLVRDLSNLEVDIRRTRKIPARYPELLAKINEEIGEVEMILMMSALYTGKS